LDRRYALGLSLIAAFLLIVLLDARHLGYLDTGDSNNLVQGARVVLHCLRRAEFVGCGHLSGSIHTLVFPYPLLQYLPAGFLVGLGMSDRQVLVALGVVSFVAFATAILAVALTFRDRPRSGALVLLALIGSSLVYQSTSAFGEALAASLVVLAVCAGIRRRPLAIFSLVFAASLGKETLAPFVVVLVLVCARSDRGVLPDRRVTSAAMAGAFSAIVLAATFNVFRFGSIKNLLYLDSPLHTPGIVRKFDFFLAISGSPSAGVFWFWPFFSALALAGTGLGIRCLIRRPDMPNEYLPVLSVTGVMLLWFAGLSAWFSPFGWVAYGPRLEVPLLAGLAVAYGHTIGDAIARVAQTHRGARLAGLAIVLAGSLQLLAPWRYAAVIHQFSVGRGTCPPLGQLDVYRDPSQYYRCTDQFIWRLRPSVFDDLVDVGVSWAAAGWFTGSIALVLLWRFIGAADPLTQGRAPA